MNIKILEILKAFKIRNVINTFLIMSCTAFLKVKALCIITNVYVCINYF